jgi:hypothetical protein
MTEPKFPKIHISNSIKIEETEYVSDELVPTLQFNISVSKETLQDHKVLWLRYFKEYNEYKGRENPTPKTEVKKQIITALVDDFNSYLWNKVFNYD